MQIAQKVIKKHEPPGLNSPNFSSLQGDEDEKTAQPQTDTQAYRGNAVAKEAGRGQVFTGATGKELISQTLSKNMIYIYI